LESFGIHQSQPKTQIPAKRANGEAALAIMDKRFERNIWLVGSAPTIADIALFAYTHVAEEGGYELSDYPTIQAWIKCIQALPKFVTMDDWPKS
jgi:glutathione S-transferase